MEVNSGRKRIYDDKDIQNNNGRAKTVSHEMSSMEKVIDLIAEDESNNNVDMEDTSLKGHKPTVASFTSIQNTEINAERNDVYKEEESLRSEVMEESRSEVNKIKVKSKQYDSSSNGKKYSMTTCCFCEFTHENTLFVITHEVVHHQQELLNVINRPEIYTRYYYKYNKKHDYMLCSLCYSKVTYNGTTKHLLCHAKHSRIPCSVCTFSSDNNYAQRSHSSAHSRQKDTDVHRLKEALDYVRCEGGLDSFSPTISVDRSTNEKHPQSSNSMNTHNKVVTASQYVSAENDVNMGVKVAKVIGKAKQEKKQKKGEKSGEEPLRKISKPKPGDGNTSSYKCNYCNFTHSHQVFTLTHEVVLHGCLLCSDLSSRLNSTIVARFSGCWPDTMEFQVCFLCGIQRAKDDPIFTIHLRHHAHPQYGNQCKTCTYSNQRWDHLQLHEAFHISEDHTIKEKIRELRDARNFVFPYKRNTHTDANQPSTSALYPQQ